MQIRAASASRRLPTLSFARSGERSREAVQPRLLTQTLFAMTWHRRVASSGTLQERPPLIGNEKRLRRFSRKRGGEELCHKTGEIGFF